VSAIRRLDSVFVRIARLVAATPASGKREAASGPRSAINGRLLRLTDTKLIAAYRVSKHTRETAMAFMTDLPERLSNRLQISSDSLRTYVDAVERAFGADVDYGRLLNFTMPSRSGQAVMPLRAWQVWSATAASNGLFFCAFLPTCRGWWL
jgi:hypothetical protein